MPSFDVVSKVDLQEVKNAVNQVQKEIMSRYDLKGSKSRVELVQETLINLNADDKLKLQALQELLRQKLAKRGVSLKSVKFGEPQAGGGDILRQEVVLKQGLTEEELRKFNKLIKAQGLKVTAQIQGDQLRVSGKKRDDLQTVIAHLRSQITDIELQFVNFRE